MRSRDREIAALREQIKAIERDNNELEKDKTLNEATVKKATNRQDHYENSISSLRSEIDILNQDKTFLTRENATLLD